MTKEEIIQNIKTRISTIESYHPEEYALNKGILFELKDLLSMIEKDGTPLPSNLDEAAEEYLNGIFGKGKHQNFYVQLFKAGAEWEAEQARKEE